MTAHVLGIIGSLNFEGRVDRTISGVLFDWRRVGYFTPRKSVRGPYDTITYRFLVSKGEDVEVSEWYRHKFKFWFHYVWVSDSLVLIEASHELHPVADVWPESQLLAGSDIQLPQFVG